MMMELTREQKRRYNRHIILQDFGAEGQARLLKAKVLIVGMGGLGSPIALYLAAAGVGTIGMVDGDFVSVTNLQRQVIHSTPDVGLLKNESAERKLRAINPELTVVRHDCFLSENNALDIIRPYDFVLDGTDNFAAKYLVNDACLMLGKPFCMGGINRYSGQVMTHVEGSACYRCMFPEPPAYAEVETCASVGVLGSIAGMMGTIQATECIKFLAQTGELLTDALLMFDAQSMQWNRLDLNRDPNCALCGERPTIKQLKEYAFKPCSVAGKKDMID